MALSDNQKEAEKIAEFIDLFNKIHFKPLSIYQDYIPEMADATGRIRIFDSEGDTIKNVKSYQEFLSWFMIELVNEAYKEGQNNLRTALKQLIGLTV